MTSEWRIIPFNVFLPLRKVRMIFPPHQITIQMWKIVWIFNGKKPATSKGLPHVQGSASRPRVCLTSKGLPHVQGFASRPCVSDGKIFSWKFFSFFSARYHTMNTLPPLLMGGGGGLRLVPACCGDYLTAGTIEFVGNHNWRHAKRGQHHAICRDEMASRVSSVRKIAWRTWTNRHRHTTVLHTESCPERPWRCLISGPAISLLLCAIFDFIYTHTHTHTHTHTKCVQTHTQCVYTHAQCVQTHTQCVQTHAKCVWTHAQCVCTHAQCVHTHAQCVWTHAQCVWTHAKCVCTQRPGVIRGKKWTTHHSEIHDGL